MIDSESAIRQEAIARKQRNDYLNKNQERWHHEAAMKADLDEVSQRARAYAQRKNKEAARRAVEGG